ncbi:MAG: oligosaccharide flippase family protein [Candidatus Omnitrophica bacterium]|nr:oligosaccharide flippase family protein [Candidatus Omnitrophota bacterium]
MHRKKQIIKDTFKLTFARYCSQGIGFFTSIAMRRFLGPFYIGIWSLLKITMDYSTYLLLGVNEGLGYKIPALMGQNKSEEEERIKDAGFSFVFIISLVTSIILLISAFVLRKNYPIEVIIGIIVLSLYILLDRICGFYMLLLRARKNFSMLSKAIIFDAATNLILIFLFVRNFKIYGLYIAVMVLSVLNTVFIHVQAKYKVNFVLNFKGLGNILKVGFPITAMGFLDWILASADRIMIAKMIGVTYVGFYSVSIMTKSYISQLSSFGTVIYPHLIEDFSKKENINDIKKYAIVPPKVNAYTLPLLLGIIFFSAPVLIKLVLPKFSPGILAIQILLIDMFFRACYPQAIHFIVALKKQARILPIMGVAIILSVVGNYLMIKKGYGIYGVAATTSTVSFFSFVAIQTYALKHFARPKEIVLFFVEILAPFVYTMIFVLLLNKIIQIQNLYVGTLIKISILFIISLPLLFYINKKTQVLNLVVGIIKDKIKLKSK